MHILRRSVLIVMDKKDPPLCKCVNKMNIAMFMRLIHCSLKLQKLFILPSCIQRL